MSHVGHRARYARSAASCAHNGQVSDAAERLRRRYPRSRVPRPLLIALVGVGVAIALCWLVWAALFHSRPPVRAQVAAFTVISDSSIAITLTVQRRDPSQPATCRVTAQAADLRPVAEEDVAVEGSTAPVVDKPVTLVTLRRAASVVVKGCTID
jgi:hypothetical protein